MRQNHCPISGMAMTLGTKTISFSSFALEAATLKEVCLKHIGKPIVKVQKNFSQMPPISFLESFQTTEEGFLHGEVECSAAQ